MSKKKLFVIDTISSFRLRYVIEAEELSDALGEITKRGSGNSKYDFEEVSQRYLGESVLDSKEITKEEFTTLLKQCESDKDEMSSYWMGEELIHAVEYNEEKEAAA